MPQKNKLPNKEGFSLKFASNVVPRTTLPQRDVENVIVVLCA
jgi:hypothetical protein